MKNIVILIYVIFAGFIYLNNYTVAATSDQNKYELEYLAGNSSHYDFALMLSSRELNHKWNNSGNFKSATAYLNDVTEIQKLIKFPAYKIYPYKHVILCIHTHFYQVNKFLPIFTQSDKSIQTEFLII